jgi:hypothetical protein
VALTHLNLPTKIKSPQKEIPRQKKKKKRHARKDRLIGVDSIPGKKGGSWDG